jgi:hypothetical protein
MVVIVALAAGIGAPVSASPLYAWQPVGYANFSAGAAQYESLSIYNGTPYVAYEDGANGYKATVMEYTGGKWQVVGTAGFSAGVTSYESLYVYNGIPYVAYSDDANGYKATVMEYTGGKWQVVGTAGFSSGGAGAYSESLYVYNGIPYVAYQDGANSQKATVMEYTGGKWQVVGSPDFSSGVASYESMSVYNGIPYVAYQDYANSQKATVMEYTGGSWQPVGSPGFSSGAAQFESLSVYNGIPYVAYSDVANGIRATVMEYTGGSWQPVGYAGFSAGLTSYESLSIYNGIPYVAYQDYANSQKATVMEYTGSSWQVVGSPGFSAGSTVYESLSVYNGIPYVVYEDYANGDKVTVMVATTTIPAVTAISPNAGPLGGGNSITITGTNLNLATNVYFGTIPATSYLVNSASQITATAPAQQAGPVDITVAANNGTSVTSAADQFTYEGPPTVTGVSPSSGPTTGGTLVTITGTNLLGASQIYFGATPAPLYSINSATQITVTAPPVSSAENAQITVTTPSGTSAIVPADQFTYIGSSGALAAVTRSMSPTVDPGATVMVTLSPSTTFVTSPGWGVTETLPAGWTFVSTSADRQSVVGGAYQFTELSGLPYITYTVIAPTAPGAYTFSGTFIDGDKDTGTVGGAVSVTVVVNPLKTYDTNHDGLIERSEAITALTDYLFNGTLSKADCVTVVSAYLFDTPVSWPATVTGISPTAGPLGGGTSVIISGYGFNSVSYVDFGTTPSVGYTVTNSTSITAPAPAGSAGTVDVTVVTPLGTSATSVDDQFTYEGPPTVTGVTPSSGITGTQVTITGTNFLGTTDVGFGPYTSGILFAVNNATSITATVPAGASGTFDFTVTTPQGTSATSTADQFTFV